MAHAHIHFSIGQSFCCVLLPKKTKGVSFTNSLSKFIVSSAPSRAGAYLHTRKIPANLS